MDAEVRDYSVLSTLSWQFFFMVVTFVEYFDTLTGRRIVSMALSAEAQSLDPNQVSHVEQLICTRSKCAPRRQTDSPGVHSEVGRV